MTKSEAFAIRVLEILEDETSWDTETLQLIRDAMNAYEEDMDRSPLKIRNALRSFAAFVWELVDAPDNEWSPDILDQIQERAGDLGLGEADSDAMFIITQAVKDFKKENE